MSREKLWLLVKLENNPNFLSLPIDLPISKQEFDNFLQERNISLSDCQFYYVFGTWGEKIDAYVLEQRLVNELNYLALILSTLSLKEYQKWDIICGCGLWGLTWSQFRVMIDVALNLDCYRYLPEVFTTYEYGKWLVENNMVSLLDPQPDYSYIGEYYSRIEEGEFSSYGYAALISPETNTYSKKGVPEEYILLG